MGCVEATQSTFLVDWTGSPWDLDGLDCLDCSPSKNGPADCQSGLLRTAARTGLVGGRADWTGRLAGLTLLGRAPSSSSGPPLSFFVFQPLRPRPPAKSMPFSPRSREACRLGRPDVCRLRRVSTHSAYVDGMPELTAVWLYWPCCWMSALMFFDRLLVDR